MFSGDARLDHDLADFSLDVALKSARTEAQLDDFGSDDFIEPLRMLIDCCLSEVPFKREGLFNFQATIQRHLVARLRLQRDVQAHPEILEEDVSDPIMILGMPRTGTTKLQRMMSADPHVQELTFWRVLNPAPFPDELPGDPAGRRDFARMVEGDAQANEEFLASHEHRADEAEEDSMLLVQAFDCAMIWHIFPSDSFLDWVRGRPQLEAHRYEKKLLQYLQWQDGGKRGRPWILKNPGAIGHLEELREVFPKITFVHSHRSLLEVMPSFCRLMSSLQTPLMEVGDLHSFARKQIEYWGPEFRRYAQARKALEASIDILDVSFSEVVRDPLPVVREAFERAGVPFTSLGERAMTRWSDANAQHKHGKPVYSLEEYGLTRESIESAFGTLEA